MKRTKMLFSMVMCVGVAAISLGTTALATMDDTMSVVAESNTQPITDDAAEPTTHPPETAPPTWVDNAPILVWDGTIVEFSKTRQVTVGETYRIHIQPQTIRMKNSPSPSQQLL